MDTLKTMFLDWFIITAFIGLIVVSAVEIRNYIKEKNQ